jgi:DNA-binding NarL/FixJ family response regulator
VWIAKYGDEAVFQQFQSLMISMDDRPEMARSSRSVGAQGFISKAAANEVLPKAVDVLLTGGTFFPNEIRV